MTLRLADGSAAQGDVLIGADGIKSVVRAQIHGEVPASYTGVRRLAPHRAAREAAGRGHGPHRHRVVRAEEPLCPLLAAARRLLNGDVAPGFTSTLAVQPRNRTEALTMLLMSLGVNLDAVDRAAAPIAGGSDARN